MCIAIFKPANIGLPSKETLQKCFQSNPDGAGFAFPIQKPDLSKKLKVLKGFETFEKFYTKFEELNATYDFKTLPLLIHFRIGTHGSKNSPEHTHPFVVSESYEDMCQLEAECDCAVIHNGILRFTGGTESNYSTTFFSRYDSAKQEYIPLLPWECPSDTMEFTKKIIYPLVTTEKFFQNNQLKELLKNLASDNKIVILNAEGEYFKIGDFSENEGVFYSNNSYIIPVKKKESKKQATTKTCSRTPSTNDKQIVEYNLRAEMIKFLSDKKQSLYLPYDEKIDTFEEALESCELKDFWPPNKRKSYDRIYASCLLYDPIFEPEMTWEKDTEFPESELYHFDSDSKFGVIQTPYLLYGNTFIWKPEDHCFDFWGVVKYNAFVAGYYEGNGKNMRWKTSRYKTYLDEMFPCAVQGERDTEGNSNAM